MPRPLAANGLLAAILAVQAGAGSAAMAQCPSPGSCLATHATPGCDDSACCNTVCGADPLCCELSWDALCVLTAEQTCVGLCGAAISLSCFVAHDTPACDDAVCCETICGFDAFCCEVRWDGACALFASLNCQITGGGECGDPQAGSCFEAHPSAACDDQSCCEGVCQLDPTCCDLVWDDFCVSLALQLCGGACQPICSGNSVQELESCGDSLNDPCYFPSRSLNLQTIPCGWSGCGKLKVSTGPLSPDVDVWKVNLVDGDGDGLVGVQLSFASAPAAFACLVAADGCAPIASAATVVDTQLCIEALSSVACVPAGQYHVVVAPGSWPDIQTTPLVCADNNAYTVKVLCGDLACAPPCNPDAGACFYAHKGVGCDDEACCLEVCAVDPSCCDEQWDSACAATAIDLCALPPTNDDCQTATDIDVGLHPLSTFAASDGPPASGCESAAAVRDVWFRYEPQVSGFVTVGTCGAALSFDSALAVYVGACGGLELVDCNDDASGACLPTVASQLSFSSSCGASYLIRVGGGEGDATLSLEVVAVEPCAPPCPGDLSGNGTVGPEDLALLLGAWGGRGAADLSGNGSVGPEDLAVLLGAWGPCG